VGVPSERHIQERALLAVNLGDDADTTGAVYGQLAGTFYGEQGIPQGWRTRLAHRALIERKAEDLLAGSQSVRSTGATG
jgi:ADP-ribosyl-[dinitrogen reductase] hydrolase